MSTPSRRLQLPRRSASLGFAISAAIALASVPGSVAPLAAADGDLDTSFDGGAFTLGWTAGHARATALEPIANGELLVGGTVGDEPGDNDGWVVAKLEANGVREFNWLIAFQVVSAGDETMAVSNELYDMARDASGRTYLAGSANAGIDNDVPMLARLGPTGALDAAFDGNGIKLLLDRPAGWAEIVTAGAQVLPDGRSVFVGNCTQCPEAEERWVWVTVRLADGSPDTGFSNDGWHSFRFTDTAYSFASDVAFDASGRIVVAGGYSVILSGEMYLARLAASGAFDGSFGGGDGIAGGWDDSSAKDIAFDPASGRIAVGSGLSSPPDSGQVRVFTAAGELDTTFSGDGRLDLDLEEGSSIRSVAFQSDGKLLAVGTIDANGDNEGGFFLARTTKTGTLDATFDDNGVKRVEFDAAANVSDKGLVVEVMGGRLVAAGFAGEGGGEDEEMAVVRTQSALLFTDGFERGSTASWNSN